jgi:single-stranded-DNA-specific exonuclease
MTNKRWILNTVDETAAVRLQSETNLPLHLAKILVQRGITDAASAESFLHPQLRNLPNPEKLKDLSKAAKRVADAIINSERVALYGDYDVDGVTSTSLLSSFLSTVGLETRFYIPKRLTEGYGLNADAIDLLASEGTQLLITLDCGITASKEIARANEKGIESIVVDHHRCPAALPEAFATLNPQQEDCSYPDKGLAAVGVCFNLVVGIRKELRERGFFSDRAEPDVRIYLDLVALGTIADMVPLQGVNRTLAWHGLLQMKTTKRLGLRALMEVSKVRFGKCGSSDVGFRLGPRINAAGRLDDASIGVQLLLSEDMKNARRHAATLDLANRQRQDIEAKVFAMSCKQIEAMSELPEALVLYNEIWHPGVVGIVATKIVERYDRPTIIIGEGGRGSGRTARGLHLYDAIDAVSDMLMKFGGHRAAAGLTIASAKIKDFRRGFIAQVASMQDKADEEPALHYDEALDPSHFNHSFVQALEQLQPFGNGNPQPLFVTSKLKVKSSRIVGKDHLKLRLDPGGVQAIAFKRGELYDQMPPGSAIEMAYHLECSEFSGVEYIELRARDLRPLI